MNPTIVRRREALSTSVERMIEDMVDPLSSTALRLSEEFIGSFFSWAGIPSNKLSSPHLLTPHIEFKISYRTPSSIYYGPHLWYNM